MNIPATSPKYIAVCDNSAMKRCPRLWKRASYYLTESSFRHMLQRAQQQGRRTPQGADAWDAILWTRHLSPK